MREFRDVELKGFNSFGIEARAERMIEFDDASDLINILKGDETVLSGRWNVLGGGNNILFTSDYKGTLLHPADKRTEVIRQSDTHVWLKVGAAADWDSLVEWCVERGYWGVENLSKIPGYAGSAPVQNIGAYGAEVKDVVVSVDMVDVDTLSPVTMPAESCGFGYRDSIFKRELAGKVIITAVNLRLSKTAQPNLGYSLLKEAVGEGNETSLKAIRNAVIEIRESKLPDPEKSGNAGSFFKNPVIPVSEIEALKERYADMPMFLDKDGMNAKLAAGWLVERAGWKGRSLGAAAVWHSQALIIVNNGGATGMDIINIAEAIRDDVRRMFGVELEMEVNRW